MSSRAAVVPEAGPGYDRYAAALLFGAAVPSHKRDGLWIPDSRPDRVLDKRQRFGRPASG